MKNILAENMRRFHTKNLSEQGPRSIDPSTPPTVAPGAAQPAPKVGFGGAEYDSASRPSVKNQADLVRKLGIGKYNRMDGKQLLDLVKTIAPNKEEYSSALATIRNEFNYAGIIPLLVAQGRRNSTTKDVYMKMATLGAANSYFDEYREQLNQIEYYLRQFGNPKEKWSLYVK